MNGRDQPAENPDGGWRRTDRESLSEHRIFTVCRDTWRDPRNGREHGFVVLDTPDWVNVIAVTEDEKIVLVRQNRVGSGSDSLEIPGGMIDPGESPLEAAQRELLEETGYRAESWTELGRVRPNPAFHSNWCTTFLAEPCTHAQAPTFDGTEDITVELHPRSEFPLLIRSGAIDHALVIAAAYWDLHSMENRLD